MKRLHKKAASPERAAPRTALFSRLFVQSRGQQRVLRLSTSGPPNQEVTRRTTRSASCTLPADSRAIAVSITKESAQRLPKANSGGKRCFHVADVMARMVERSRQSHAGLS